MIETDIFKIDLDLIIVRNFSLFLIVLTNVSVIIYLTGDLSSASTFTVFVSLSL